MGLREQGQQLECANREACSVGQSSGSDVDGTSTPDAKDAPAKCFNSDDETTVDSSVQYSMGIRRHSGPNSYSWQEPVQTLPPMCCTLPNGGSKQQLLQHPQQLLAPGKRAPPLSSNNSSDRQPDGQQAPGTQRQQLPMTETKQQLGKAGETPRPQQQRMDDLGSARRSQGPNRPSYTADQSPATQRKGSSAGVLSPVAACIGDTPFGAGGPRIQQQYLGLSKQLPLQSHQGLEPFKDQNPRLGVGHQPQQPHNKLAVGKEALDAVGHYSSRNSSGGRGSSNSSDCNVKGPSGAGASAARPQQLAVDQELLSDVPRPSSKAAVAYPAPSASAAAAPQKEQQQQQQLLGPMQVLRAAGAHISSSNSSSIVAPAAKSSNSSSGGRGNAGTASKAGPGAASSARSAAALHSQQQQQQVPLSRAQFAGPALGSKPLPMPGSSSSSSSTPTAGTAAAAQPGGPSWSVPPPAPPPPPPPPPPRRQQQVVLVPSQDIRKAPGTLVPLTANTSTSKTQAPKPSAAAAAVGSPVGVAPPAPPPHGPPGTLVPIPPPAPPAGHPPSAAAAAAAAAARSRDAGKEAGRQLLQQLQQPNKLQKQKQQQQQTNSQPVLLQQQQRGFGPAGNAGGSGLVRQGQGLGPQGSESQGTTMQAAGALVGFSSTAQQQEQHQHQQAVNMFASGMQPLGRPGPPSVSSSGPSSSGSSSSSNRGRNAASAAAASNGNNRPGSRTAQAATAAANTSAVEPSALAAAASARYGSAPPGIGSSRSSSGAAGMDSSSSGRITGQNNNSSWQGSAGVNAASAHAAAATAAGQTGWINIKGAHAPAPPPAVRSPVLPAAATAGMAPTAKQQQQQQQRVPAAALAPAGSSDENTLSPRFAGAVAMHGPANSVSTSGAVGAGATGSSRFVSVGGSYRPGVTSTAAAAAAAAKGKENHCAVMLVNQPESVAAVSAVPVKPEVLRTCADVTKLSATAAVEAANGYGESVQPPPAAAAVAASKANPVVIASCLPEDEDDLLGITPSSSSTKTIAQQQLESAAPGTADLSSSQQQQAGHGSSSYGQQQSALGAQPPPPPRKLGGNESSAARQDVRGGTCSVSGPMGVRPGQAGSSYSSMSPPLPQPGHRMVLSPGGMSPVWSPYGAGGLGPGSAAAAAAPPSGHHMGITGSVPPGGQLVPLNGINPHAAHIQQPIGSPASVMPGTMLASSMYSPQMQQQCAPAAAAAAAPAVVKPVPSKRLEIVDPKSRKGSSNQLFKANGSDAVEIGGAKGVAISSAGRSASCGAAVSTGLLQL